MTLSTDPPPLEIYLLGIADFWEVQQLQRRLAYEVGERSGACLILCEHAPTISIGREGSRAHIAADDDLLRSLGIRTHWINRGGGCVLHLPGQICAYFIAPLGVLGLTLQSYLDSLSRTMVRVLDEFDLQSWIDPNRGEVYLGEKRVGTVGVAVTRWIAYHGLTLNVGPSLELFQLLEEPGISSARLRQTSMESRRQRTVPMPKARESLIRHFEDEFGFRRHHIYTSHPMIRRKVLSHAYAPSPG